MEKTKKVLFVATVDSHIELFHLPYLKMFKDKGWEVHVATESDKPIKYCDKKIKIPITRSPFKLSNIKAIKELRKVIEEEKYDIIHCHTPMGGVVARMAAKHARKNGTRVIYTAHGFHFFKGAPLHYWAMFYPVEKYLAKYTDTLITINHEDFDRAKRKFGKRCKDIQMIDGIGVDYSRFDKRMSKKEIMDKRKKLGLQEGDFVIIYSAEISKRKRQLWLISQLADYLKKNKRVHLILAGKDSLSGKCQKYVKRIGLESQIHFLGFRNDISELYQISDLAISAAKQEGLGLNVIEAIKSGLLVLISDNRGHREIMRQNANGVIIADKHFKNTAAKFIDDIKASNISPKKTDIDVFSLDNVKKEMQLIYFNQNDSPIRILQVFNVMKYGGAESFIMNIYREIDRKKLQFDFLVHGNCVYEDEIKKLGGKVYHLPGYITEIGPFKLKKELKNFFLTHNYKVVHSHVDKTSGFILNIAKKVSGPVCISHSHCAGEENSFVVAMYKKYLQSKLNKVADYKIACSDNAGKWLFKKGYIVVNNPINIERFSFDKRIREQLRGEYGIGSNEVVLGVVARLDPIKNIAFLIDVFSVFHKKNENSKLVIVGDGSEKENILNKIKEKELEDFVVIMTPRPNIEKVYNMFDVFILPSKSEGLGIALLEAAANGLPIVCTSNIPREIAIKTKANTIDEYDPKEWSRQVEQAVKKKRDNKGINIKEYDVKTIVSDIEDIYKEAWSKYEK